MLFAYFAGLISYEQLIREVDILSLEPVVQQAIEDTRKEAR